MPNYAWPLLRLRLALERTGTGVLLAGALMLGAAVMWFAVLPGVVTRVDQQTRAVARARSAPLPARKVSPAALGTERLAAFYAALGDAAHTEQIVTQLFDAAADAGVVLDEAEYKPAQDVPGRFETYTIILPVKGDYAHLRSFCEKVLLAVPYAALDDMRLKRNSASDPTVEANLRFTVFLKAGAQEAATRAEVSEVRR